MGGPWTLTKQHELLLAEKGVSDSSIALMKELLSGAEEPTGLRGLLAASAKKLVLALDLEGELPLLAVLQELMLWQVWERSTLLRAENREQE